MTQADLSARLIALLTEINPEAALWDGLDDAIVGIVLRDDKPVALYDHLLMLGVLVERDGMPWHEAKDWVAFNIVGVDIGPGTPLLADVDTFFGTEDE